MIDSSIVKVHRHGQGAKGGLRAPGQAHDMRGTTTLLEGLTCGRFLAERAVDANLVREALEEAEIEPQSKRRLPADFERKTCKWGHLTAKPFGKLKEFRRIATRCRKKDGSFSAFIALAATVIRMR